MFNDEDDDMPAEVDPDAEIADADGGDDDADITPAARKPKRAAAKKPTATKAAAKARKAKSVTKAAPVKAAAKPPRKAAKAAKKPAAKKAAKAPVPPADLSGVKAGAHTLWVSKDLARALTSKDRRRLKALLKRAEKRRKSKKK
jgi:hypothetical protein